MSSVLLIFAFGILAAAIMMVPFTWMSRLIALSLRLLLGRQRSHWADLIATGVATLTCLWLGFSFLGQPGDPEQMQFAFSRMMGYTLLLSSALLVLDAVTSKRKSKGEAGLSGFAE